jgi:hypothetical protein
MSKSKRPTPDITVYENGFFGTYKYSAIANGSIRVEGQGNTKSEAIRNAKNKYYND